MDKHNVQTRLDALTSEYKQVTELISRYTATLQQYNVRKIQIEGAVTELRSLLDNSEYPSDTESAKANPSK